MMDPNIQRGQSTFNSLLQSSKQTMDTDACERLEALKAHYWENVGIMPMNGLYAAKRLAEACITAAASELSGEDSIALTEKIYEESAQGKSTSAFRLSNQDVIKDRGKVVDGYSDSGDKEHDDTTKFLANIIDSTVVSKGVESFVVDEEDGEIREFDAEVVDLIEDAAAEGQLSVEGMRAMGLVGMDFDTTKDKITDEIITSAHQLTQQPEKKNWSYDADGFLTIFCPSCGEDKIYPMGESMFGCFKCDTEFKFTHNLGDVSS